MMDWTPLQVRFPDSKEQSELESIEEADFSTEGEDIESKWEHIFSRHTFAEPFIYNIVVEEPVDNMAIVPF